jgi:putative transposase
VVSREQKKEAVRISAGLISERKACIIFEIHRSVVRHKKVNDDIELEEEIKRIAYKKKRYGYRMIYDVIRKKRKVNHKKIYRLYIKLGLKYRIKKKKKRISCEKVPLIVPEKIGIRWSMDFVTDSLYNGRRFRVFNLIDDCSRESIIQYADFSISGRKLVRLFEELKLSRGFPKQIVCDNGTEFTSKIFMKWAADNNIDLHFIDKGRPMQNGFVESFNGKFRNEYLNEEWFLSIREARDKIRDWQKEYNTERPHSSLGGLSPYEFIGKIA